VTPGGSTVKALSVYIESGTGVIVADRLVELGYSVSGSHVAKTLKSSCCGAFVKFLVVNEDADGPGGHIEVVVVVAGDGEVPHPVVVDLRGGAAVGLGERLGGRDSHTRQFKPRSFRTTSCSVSPGLLPSGAWRSRGLGQDRPAQSRTRKRPPKSAADLAPRPRSFKGGRRPTAQDPRPRRTTAASVCKSGCYRVSSPRSHTHTTNMIASARFHPEPGGPRQCQQHRRGPGPSSDQTGGRP
jgi:hypothetical protein